MTEHEALLAEIRRSTDAADPREELATLLRRVADADGALDAARVEAIRHDTELAAATEAQDLAFGGHEDWIDDAKRDLALI